MAELVHTYSSIVLDRTGLRYRAEARGERNELGTWFGWLVFRAEDGSAAVLRTDRETTQPNRAALEYWASGLEPVYLEGALVRAQPL